MDIETKVRFQGVIDDAIKKYNLKEETKGDSWKVMKVNYLRALLRHEVFKWMPEAESNGMYHRKVNAGSAEYDYLKNILNVTLMLMSRIRDAQIKWAKDRE